jgi:hypothetical protein
MNEQSGLNGFANLSFLQGFEALACFCLVRELHPHSLSKHFKENI